MTDTTIVFYTSNPTALAVAASKGKMYRSELLTNPATPLDVWASLYTLAKPDALPVKDAKSAVATALPDDRAHHVLITETRPSVLAAMIKSSYPSAALLADPTYRTHIAVKAVDDTLGRRYGGSLDIEALAAHPGEAFGPALRVHRLLSTTLSDVEVLSELRSFDTWSQPWRARPFGWVLHTRPGVFASLAAEPDSIPLPVLTQMAGSDRMGALEPEEQLRLLRADGDPAAISADLADQLSFTWMAAASNPGTHLDVVEALRPFLNRPADGDDRVAVNRSRRRPWQCRDLATEADPDRLSELVNWAITREKVRVGPVSALLANPHLSDADAGIIAERARAANQFDENNLSLMSAPPAVAMLRRAVARFSDPELTEKFLHLLYDAGFGVPAPHRDRLGFADLRLRDREGNAWDNDDSHAAASRTRVWSMSRGSVAWLDNHLGDNTAAWEMALSMTKTLNQLNVAEYGETCLSLVV